MMRYFEDGIAPLLSPQIIDFHHPFPHLVNQALYIAVLLKGNKKINLCYFYILLANASIFAQKNSLP
jgi:polyphosphate kinase